MLSTDKQTNKQTDKPMLQKITSFVKEVIKALRDYCVLTLMNLTQHYALIGFQKLLEPTSSNKLKKSFQE